MILTPPGPRPPIHVTDRRNGGVRLSACGRDLYLSGVEAEALLDYLESRRQGSEAAASA